MSTGTSSILKGADLRDAVAKDLLLTRAEFACYLRVCPDTISNYAKQGMPHVYMGDKKRLGKGADLRFKPSMCEKWLIARSENVQK